MGKQVRFFMTNKDEVDFLKVIVQFNNSILDNKAFVLTVEEAKLSTNNLSLFITSQNANISKDNNGFVDPIVAEVIQFSRCMILEDKYLRNGRVWAEFKYYDGKKLVNKSKEFKDTYNIYEKWIKKNFRLSKCKDYYIAKDAYRAYKEDGIILVTGPKQVIEFD